MAKPCKICHPHPNGVTRRGLLRMGLGGFLGFAAARQAEALGMPALDLLMPGRPRGTAKACIVLWLTGGPPTIDMWDPKPGTDTGGRVKTIETGVEGLIFGEHLPNVAKVADKLAVVHSMTSKEGSHERARYLMHTGYVPTGTVVHPSIGSVTAMEIGKKDFDLPNFIAINQPSEGAGFLPPDNSPFLVDNPGGPIRNLGYGSGVNKDRFLERLKMLGAQEKDFAEAHASEEVDKHKSAYEKAERLMHTPLLKAFDLSAEKPELAKAYGDSKFGKGCLLARRLVETGVKFIEVGSNGWDLHQETFDKLPGLCGPLDKGMGALIQDLSDRDMLKETLVVCMGDFGRTPRVNGNNGRDHYPKAWSLVMAGGGIQPGRVIGSTDKDGIDIKDRPVTVPDLMATMYSALGIDPEKKVISPLGRPLKFADNGTPVKELLS